MVILFLTFAGGIWLAGTGSKQVVNAGVSLNSNLTVLWVVAVVGLIVLLVAAAMVGKEKRQKGEGEEGWNRMPSGLPGEKVFLISILIALFLLAGWIRAQENLSVLTMRDEVWRSLAGKTLTVQGVVDSFIDYRRNDQGEKIYFYLREVELVRMSGEPERADSRLPGRLMVCITEGREPESREFNWFRKLNATKVATGESAGGILEAGERIEVRGLLRLPAEPGNPGQYDYRAYLSRRDTAAVLYCQPAAVKKASLGSPEEKRWSDFLFPYIYHMRERLLAVNNETLPVTAAALVNGMVWGVRGNIAPEINHLLTETGLVHILSVSGLHVGLVGGGLLLVAHIFRCGVRTQAVLIVPFLTFYALLTGADPPVLRATLMASLLLIGRAIGHRADTVNLWAAAGLLLLLVNPQTLYDPGFQLSFLSTWGLLEITPVLNRLLGRFWPLPSLWLHLLTVPVAAQLAVWPLTACYFGLFSPSSLPANVLTAYPAAFILYCNLAATLIGQVSLLLAGVLNASVALAVDIFLGLTAFCRQLPLAVFSLPAPLWWQSLAWYLLLVYIIYRFNRGEHAVTKKDPMVGGSVLHGRSVSRGSVFFLSVVVTLLLSYPLKWFYQEPNELIVHFIDVGQGDAILVRYGGENMLVDCGGYPGEMLSGHGAGDGIVVPYLRRLGINRLDFLVLTHPHEDHVGGARAVINSFPIKQLIIPLLPPVEEVEGASSSPQGEKAVLADWEVITSLAAEKGAVITEVSRGDVWLLKGVRVEVLNPPLEPLYATRSDLNNGSLVLNLRWGGVSVLLTADVETEAQENMLAAGVVPIAPVFKVPHHGSRFSSSSFVETVQPRLAVISCGRNNRFGFPAEGIITLLRSRGAKVVRTDQMGAIVVRCRQDGTISFSSHLTIPADD